MIHCSFGNVCWAQDGTPSQSPSRLSIQRAGATCKVIHYLVVWLTLEHRAELLTACASWKTISKATNGVRRLLSWNSYPYA